MPVVKTPSFVCEHGDVFPSGKTNPKWLCSTQKLASLIPLFELWQVTVFAAIVWGERPEPKSVALEEAFPL
jgi:hypothetical protein